jgi:hypothetical protein
MFYLGNHILGCILVFGQALLGAVYLALIVFVVFAAFLSILRLAKVKGEGLERNQE